MSWLLDRANRESTACGVCRREAGGAHRARVPLIVASFFFCPLRLNPITDHESVLSSCQRSGFRGLLIAHRQVQLRTRLHELEREHFPLPVEERLLVLQF